MLDHEDDILAKVTSHQVAFFTCPRCGEVHKEERFDPIQNPSDMLFKHWYYCSVAFSPVLLYWDGQIAHIK